MAHAPSVVKARSVLVARFIQLVSDASLVGLQAVAGDTIVAASCQLAGFLSEG